MHQFSSNSNEDKCKMLVVIVNEFVCIIDCENKIDKPSSLDS